MSQLSITNRTGSRGHANLYGLPFSLESNKDKFSQQAEDPMSTRSGELKILTVEQIRALREERKNYARFQQNLHALPVAALLVDEKGRIEFANQEFGRIMGFDVAEIVGKDFAELIVDRRVLAKGESENGRPTSRVLGRLQNESENKQVLFTETVMEVSGKAKILAVFQDGASYEEQVRSNQNFVAMVTHELKTPLTCVNGILSLMEDGVLGDLNTQGKVMTQQVRETCRRLVRLINDLLDLERIQAGKLALDCKRYKISKLCQTAVEGIIPIAGDRRLTLEQSRDDLFIMADEDRVVQVLINLLSNSIKFSDHNSSIRIVAEEMPGQDMVMISVEDEGRGIPADKADKIFECFEQVDILDAKVKGGSGLGLAICKAIVEAHGGKIGLSREKKKGCTIWFTMPRA